MAKVDLLSVSGKQYIEVDGVPFGPLALAPAQFQQSGPWSVVTVAAPATDVSIAGLSGDADGSYEIFVYAKSISDTASILIRPNGADINCLSNSTFCNATGGDATVTGTSQANLYLGSFGTSGVDLSGRAILTSKSGVYRSFESNSYQKFVGGVLASQSVHTTGQWLDTSTLITSLAIHATVAGAIAAGSFVAWRSLNRGF